MLTSLENPIIEAWKVRLEGDAQTTQAFIKEFLDSPDADEFKTNPAGAPGVFIFNPRSPLEGLQAFGFEGAENLKNLLVQASAKG
jgi:aspartyl-tRNA synthetase